MISLFFISLCVCLPFSGVCACACVCVRRRIFVGAHGSQRPFSRVVPPQLSTLFFETGAPADQELTKLARLMASEHRYLLVSSFSAMIHCFA